MKNKTSHSSQGQSHIPRMAVYKGIIKYLTEFFKSVQEAESLYCTPIAYIILCSNYTSIKKKKKKKHALKKKKMEQRRPNLPLSWNGLLLWIPTHWSHNFLLLLPDSDIKIGEKSKGYQLS